MLGDIVGTGVLSLAACFAALGWLPAMILLVFFSLANLHTGLMIHRVAMLHPKRGYTYGGLIAAVLEDEYPRLTRVMWCMIYLFLFLLLGDYLLVLALSLQEIFYTVRLCRPVAAAVACGLLLVTNQLRTLKQVAIATVCGTSRAA